MPVAKLKAKFYQNWTMDSNFEHVLNDNISRVIDEKIREAHFLKGLEVRNVTVIMSPDMKSFEIKMDEGSDEVTREAIKSFMESDFLKNLKQTRETLESRLGRVEEDIVANHG